MKKTVNNVVFYRSAVTAEWFSPIRLAEGSIGKNAVTAQYFVRKHATLKRKYTLSVQYSNADEERTLCHASTITHLLSKSATALEALRIARQHRE